MNLIWTNEKLQKEANKYQTRKDFKKKNKSAYMAALKNEVINEIFKNHPNQGYLRNKFPVDYWTNERLQEKVNNYQTRCEFIEKNKSVYKLALKKGIVNELFKNHPNQGYSSKQVRHGYWTKERLQEEANKYKNRKEFQVNGESAYHKATKKDMLDELFKNHINNGYQNLPSKTYTIEKLQEEVNKYITRVDFKNNSTASYSMVYKKNLLNELFKNHPNQGYVIRDVPWTKEKLQKEISKYKNRKEFREADINAFQYAYNLGIIDELFKKHRNKGFSTKRKSNNYWTKEKVKKEIKKYNTRKEFREAKPGAYKMICKNKLLNKLFENHQNKGFLIPNERANFNYIIYAYEILKYNKVYVGLTYNIKKRDREHLFTFKSKLNKFCKEKKIPLPKPKILEKNLTPQEAQLQEEYWLNFYKNRKWETFNMIKTGGLGGNKIIWTKEKLYELTKNFKYRNDFKKENKGAYAAALNYKLMKELFKNHPNQGFKYREHRYLSNEELQEEANNYKTRTEFQKKDPGAYGKARKNGLINELFKNHINNGFKSKKLNAKF